MKTDYIENLIIKAMCTDQQYLVTIANIFQKDYFENQTAVKIFSFLKDYVTKYESLPQKDIIINSVQDAEEYLNELESIDVDLNRNYDFIFDKTNEYLKDRALKKAILDSVDIINKGDKKNDGKILKYIEDALSKDLKVDLGLDYFMTNKDRLKRVLNDDVKRIPTYYPSLDEMITGGFKPYTLSVFTARIHGFKSSMLSNLAARQVLNGHTVVIITLEMSEDSVAQRIDSIYSGLDINKLYNVKEVTISLIKKLSELSKDPNIGKLLIKEFPTGEASVLDIKRYIRELKMRNIHPDIVYVDYINLMRSTLKGNDDLYGKVKKIAEELRAMSFTFNIPVVSVSQLNREGSSIINLREIDFTHISESLGLPATVDFMSIFGSDDENMIYKSELSYKIVKNRLGGRVGTINKLYFDSRTLKIYDVTEIDQWIEDANKSGDDRELAPKENRRTPGRRKD